LRQRIAKGFLQEFVRKLSKDKDVITVQTISDYTTGQKRPGIERAFLLVEAARKMGVITNAIDWLSNPKKIRQKMIKESEVWYAKNKKRHNN